MSGRSLGVVVVFVIAVFGSAWLLFLVQPIAARLVLPLLGGSPAVWNTCMLFFQTVLLLGYAYAHALARLRNPRTQVIVHALVAGAAIVTLPIGFTTADATAADSPVWWLSRLLVQAVGVPFAVLSATGPLLQRWFSNTDHSSARDPYFLYAASNAGSLLALVAYPVLVERTLRLGQQTVWWSWSFAALAAAVLVAGAWHLRRTRDLTPGAASGPPVAERTSGSISIEPVGGRGVPRATDHAFGTRERFLCVALAAVPSSLMLGATTFISTDLAAVPLLWVIPLAIYLLTMILAYSRVQAISTRLGRIILPIAVLAVTVAMLMHALSPILVIVGLHLAALFAGAMACHGRLASMRPDPRHLTSYFLLISVGGAIGGVFNAIVAPLVFTGVYEYPIVLAAACALGMVRQSPSPREGLGRENGNHANAHEITSKFNPPLPVPPGEALGRMELRPWRGRVAHAVIFLSVPVAVVGLLAGMAMLPRVFTFDARWKSDAMTYGVPALACFLIARWPARFAVAIAGFLLIAVLRGEYDGRPILTHRSFFGVLRVTEVSSQRQVKRQDHDQAQSQAEAPPKIADAPAVETRRFHELIHGSTAHGLQALGEPECDVPLTYYYPTGPAGLAFLAMDKAGYSGRVGAVGLGSGAVAAYGQPGQSMTFFEIDAAVRDIASDPRLFTYLQRCQANVEVRLGDGRHLIEQDHGAPFDILVLDAFSSDAIPIHLLTADAFRSYADHLSDRGLLLVHISNRHLRLLPVVRGIAGRLSLAGREFYDEPSAKSKLDWEFQGKFSSFWVVLAKSEVALEVLGPDARWLKFETPKTPDPVWTDDFSNILDVLEISL